MASKTPNLGLQTSKMASGTCPKPSKLRNEPHLLTMPTILTLLNRDHSQANNQEHPQDLRIGLKIAPKTSQDGLRDPNLRSSNVQHGLQELPPTSQIPIRTPLFLLLEPISSNIASEIPKTVPKSST